MKSKTILLSLLLTASLASCINEKPEETAIKISDYLSSTPVSVSRINIKRGATEISYNVFNAYSKEFNVYKYAMKDNPSQFIYSLDYHNSKGDIVLNEFTENSYNTEEINCTYVGVAGTLSDIYTLNLYQEENYLLINHECCHNISMPEQDYQAFKKQHTTIDKASEKNMAIYNLSNEAYLSFHTFSYYIDLNRYTSYEYIATDKDEPVKKEITKVSNEKTISSDYLITSNNGTLDFCLGGKTNLLDLNAYQNGDDIKYIPSDDNTKLPYTLTINDKEYETYNAFCGTVFLSIDCQYDYKKNELKYKEYNYTTANIDQDIFQSFMNQGQTSYTIDGNKHIIDTKKELTYPQTIETTKDLIFVYVA